MSEDSDRDTWRITIDREQIMVWAEKHDVVPGRVEKEGGDYELRLLTDREDVQGEQISWDQFFDRLEVEWLAVRYRETATSEDERPAYEFVDREEMTEDESGAGVDREDAAERSEDTAMSESAHGAETGVFVLDEIHEERGLTDDVSDEYLKFRNTADDRLDLSGWVVENDDGQTYVFPDGFVLDAGEHVTLHSGDGTDSETDLYWGATKPIWDDDGDTVTVTTANSEQVLREPYNE
jgi:hypothetical protein